MILRGGTPPRQMQFRQTRTVARPSISEVIHQLLVAPSLPFPRSRFSRGRLKTTSDFGTGSFIQRRMMLRVGGSWNIFGMSFLARNRCIAQTRIFVTALSMADAELPMFKISSSPHASCIYWRRRIIWENKTRALSYSLVLQRAIKISTRNVEISGANDVREMCVPSSGFAPN